MGGLGAVGFDEDVAEDAVRSGEAEVVREEGSPGDFGVDGVEEFVEGFLLGLVEGWLGLCLVED